MKLKLIRNTLVVALGALGILASPQSRAAELRERIGTYDSRAIAYAHFWTDAQQRKLGDLTKQAKEAKAAGQTNRLHDLEAALKREQERNHLQVFSTAAVDDVFAGMPERIADIKKTADVTLLVSKWDTKTLQAHRSAEQIDVTGDLLSEFKLTEKQLRVVERIRNQKPLPLEKATRLTQEGKL